jgi:hypothetical protein
MLIMYSLVLVGTDCMSSRPQGANMTDEGITSLLVFQAARTKD